MLPNIDAADTWRVNDVPHTTRDHHANHEQTSAPTGTCVRGLLLGALVHVSFARCTPSRIRNSVVTTDLYGVCDWGARIR